MSHGSGEDGLLFLAQVAASVDAAWEKEEDDRSDHDGEGSLAGFGVLWNDKQCILRWRTWGAQKPPLTLQGHSHKEDPAPSSCRTSRPSHGYILCQFRTIFSPEFAKRSDRLTFATLAIQVQDGSGQQAGEGTSECDGREEESCSETEVLSPVEFGQVGNATGEDGTFTGTKHGTADGQTSVVGDEALEGGAETPGNTEQRKDSVEATIGFAVASESQLRQVQVQARPKSSARVATYNFLARKTNGNSDTMKVM